MKKLIVAVAIVASATALASSFQHQRKAFVLDQQYYEDTPKPKKDTIKSPWPDTTKRPTPPGN